MARIDQMRMIADYKRPSKIDGVDVDINNAVAYTRLHDLLTPDNKVRLEGLPLVPACALVGEVYKRILATAPKR